MKDYYIGDPIDEGKPVTVTIPPTLTEAQIRADERNKVLEEILAEYDRQYQAIAKSKNETRVTPRTVFHDIITQLKGSDENLAD